MTINMCSSMPPIQKAPQILNLKMLDYIKLLPGGVRKELRLLAKQYHIIEVYKLSDEECHGHKVRESPYVIKYQSFEDCCESVDRRFEKPKVFTWEIDARRMY